MTGHEIAESALAGHVGTAEITAAQNQFVGMLLQRIHAAENIFRCVLTIGICGNAAGQIGKPGQTVMECGFQGTSFTAVGIVSENCAAIFRCLFIQSVKGGIASIVYDDNIPIIIGTDVADQVDHSIVRFVRRDNDWNTVHWYLSCKR